MTDARLERLTVDEDADGERLDAFVAGATDLSRSRVQKLIRDGEVRVGGATVTRKAEPVEEGQLVEVVVPAPEVVEIVAEDLGVPIVFEDARVVVVDKPAGMVVHPAPGHRSGTLVNALMHQVTDLSGVGGRLRPGIVHRLDKDTSGLLVVAKDDGAHHALSDALRRREVGRVYTAASWGHLSDDQVSVDAPLARHPRDRYRMAVVEGGRRAVTHVRRTERWAAADLLEVTLETGRTHQIRVHLAHVGHPVVGDDLYGAGRHEGMSGPHRGWARELAKRTPRQFLHASRLAFRHPEDGREMAFASPLPPDLAAVAAWAREPEADATAERPGKGRALP